MKKIIIYTFLGISLLGTAQNSYNLAEAIEFATENAYAIKNAKLDIDKAQKKKWETTTMGLPQINGSVNYQNFLKQPIALLPAQIFGGPAGEFAEVTFGTKQNIDANATLSQLLFDGSYIVGLQSAKVYLKISELAKEKTKIGIKETVINAYGNVLLAKESIQILESNLKLMNKNIKDTQKIFENGFAEEQDVEQLQITKSSIESQLSNAKRMLIVAKNMLKLAMGIPMNETIILKDNLDTLALQNTNLEIINQDFDINNHIDYKMEKNAILAKELLLKLEKSKYLPSLSTFINIGTTANSDEFTFTNTKQRWFASSIFGVSLNVPIFSSFKRKSKVAQAKITLEQEKTNLTEIEQKLQLQVENAKNSYQFALDNFKIAKDRMALAERIENKEKIKFFEGVGSSFTLTQAQSQLFTTQQNYLEAIVNIINAKAKLETALDIN